MTSDARELLLEWISAAENMMASLPVDLEAIEVLIARSKDLIDQG